MCGRYTIRKPGLIAKLVYQEEFEEFSELKLVPRWNVAPSQDVPVIRTARSGKCVIGLLRWGLIPSWTKGKPKAQPINARSETVATSGMFRQAFERRRCLMPADGFYEWKGAKPPKTPHFIRRPDDAMFAFAAVWERWKPDPDAEPVETCCQLTTTPNGVMRPIHDRMPVILHAKDFERWLSRDVPGEDVQDLLRPLEDSAIETYAVSTAVNSVKHEGPELVEPFED